MTCKRIRKKYMANNTSLLLFNDIIYKKVNIYDSLEECYHMNRCDWMIKTKNYLPPNYSTFRNIISQLHYNKKHNFKTKHKAQKIIKFYRELKK